MTEEVKNAEIQQECFCKKKFKDVVAIAIGSFVGVFCALSLFAALHKPPMPCPCAMHGFHPHYGMMHGAMMHHKMSPVREKFSPEQFKGKFEDKKPVEND